VEDPGEPVRGVFGHKEKQANSFKDGERGDGKCGNEVTWSLA
jgi:hypothetical protein